MRNNDDHIQKIKCLELTIEEQRRDHDFLDRAYGRVNTKIITFLAATLGLLGYLYVSDSSAKSLKDKMFIPDEAYGVVIYAVAFGLFLTGIAALLYALRPGKWSTAYEVDYVDPNNNCNYEHHLQYMKNRYDKCAQTNGASYVKKQKLLDFSFIPLLLGGILLLILKTFTFGG